MPISIKNKKTTSQYDFSNKRVLVRVDFNVPFKDGKISNDFRILSAIPTIKRIIESKPKYIILLSHLGRPAGQRKDDLSFKPLLSQIKDTMKSQSLNNPLEFLDLDLLSENFSAETNKMSEVNRSEQTKIYLFENIRFYKEEESKTMNDNVSLFRRNLTSLGDVFVFDAFGCSHRAHSSVVGVGLERVSGMLMEKECRSLGQFIESGDKNMCLLLGGAKVSDKVKLISNMLDKIKVLIIGGAMANTFLSHTGYNLGNSFIENGDEVKETVKNVISKAKKLGVELVLPIDLVGKDGAVSLESIKHSPVADASYCDIGTKSIELFLDKIKSCDKVFWNGPMGKFEEDEYAKGTFKLLEEISKQDIELVIGGGDTASAAKKIGNKLGKQVYISTGGGASLEFLEGKELPGLNALSDA
eukprot:GAHX01000390.1.p1 GENE.GAHX01000390.1~~GAHX01000390.1.p1  ORF type:complete len:414 (+),score=89.62 GAHX01000390.1:40-1281(+)